MGELLHNTTDTGRKYDHALQKQKRETGTASKGSCISVLGSSLEFCRFESFWGIEASDILLLFPYWNNGRHETEQKFYLNNRKSLLINF